jgi:hypothetical protein
MRPLPLCTYADKNRLKQVTEVERGCIVQVHIQPMENGVTVTIVS